MEILGAGEIKDVKIQGFENADASDLGELVANRQSPSLAAFRLRAGDANQPRALAVNVARYDQQAVLLANIEEARYRILLSKEGKTLVQARYAVRNNQRNFVKIALPAGATLWSAALSGQPVRPGQAPDGNLLLPLEKSKAGGSSADDSPEFAVEIVYLMPGTIWTDKGKAHIALPALDLPVSRTGLQVYYPPLFRVASEPGTFRTETFSEPFSPVLSASGAGAAGGSVGGGSGNGVDIGSSALVVNAPSPEVVAPPPPGVSGLPMNGRDMPPQQTVSPDTTKSLVDKYHSSSAVGRATGVLPLSVNFPAFGPSVYLVSQLTSENQSPTAELNFQQDKKGAAR